MHRNVIIMNIIVNAGSVRSVYYQIGRARRRAPVNQATGWPVFGPAWGEGPLRSVWPCRPAAPFGGRRRDGDLVGGPGLQRAVEGCTGRGGKPSRQKPPRRPAAGSRPRVVHSVQPRRDGRTEYFLLLFLFILFLNWIWKAISEYYIGLILILHYCN